MTSKKIIASISIAFIITFSSLLVFQFFSRSYVDVFRLQDEFYSKELGAKKKIFIVGSSESAVLNNTHINEYLKKNGHDYDVYNLSLPSDQPSSRLQTIDKIIKLKPDVVIYGVGYRDFANQFTLIHQQNENLNVLLPNPQNLFNSIIHQTNSNLDLIKSPKFVTEKVLDTIVNDIAKKNNVKNYDKIQPKTPFYKFSKESKVINQKIDTVEPIGYIDSSETNDEVIALNQIINKLKNNNIEIVLFTTPYSRIFFDNLSDHNKNTFDNILTDILNKHNIPIYRLEDNYADLNIWYDYNHVAMNPHAIIFTHDIEEILVKVI